jgi:predicted NBD/HSP70 family sugar kinase/biotin operon repressor
LQTLRIFGPISRINLAKQTGLSRAAISVAISDLIEQGMVKETERRQQKGGRPAAVLELAPGFSISIGAEFDNEKWKLGAFDLIGSTVRSIEIPVPRPPIPEEVFAVLARNLGDFDTDLVTLLPVIGLGLPGLVDSHNRTIIRAADLNWQNIKIDRVFRPAVDRQIVMVNRHQARGLYECRFGAGFDSNGMVNIGVGTGIMAGLLVGRQLVSGAHGGAGEFGHITIEPNGMICVCGNRGCLQLYASATAIEQKARNLLRLGRKSILCTDPYVDLEQLKADQICQAADLGDDVAMQAVNEAASYLGIALANLVNTDNPHLIILGGPIPRSNKHYVETAIKTMKQRAIRFLASNTIVRTASFNEYGGAAGAAAYALDQTMTYAMLTRSDGSA